MDIEVLLEVLFLLRLIWITFPFRLISLNPPMSLTAKYAHNGTCPLPTASILFFVLFAKKGLNLPIFLTFQCLIFNFFKGFKRVNPCGHPIMNSAKYGFKQEQLVTNFLAIFMPKALGRYPNTGVLLNRNPP